MSFNMRLAKEVYGMNPWFMDAYSLPLFSNILKQSKSGISLEMPEQKCNTPFFFKVSSDTRIISNPYQYGYGQLENNDDFEGIGVINIDGPITKSGGMSSYGMSQLSSMMLKMHQDNRIKGFVVLGDSGGGSGMAVELMTDTIAEVRKTKPVYGHVEKGGMSASAMYGIHSACEKLYAESEMSILGSCGTMLQFESKVANSTDPDGTQNVRLYATKSTKKNEEFEEAANNNNYDLLINDVLDPFNERFLSLILGNRPMLKGTNFDDGHTVYAKDGVGTFIDGIQTLDKTIEMVMSDYNSNYKEKNKPSKNKNSNTNTLKTNSMTAEELQAQHPATYNSIFNAGVASGTAAELDRCGAWMAHASTDIESVTTGIESGKPISQTQTQKFMVMANSKQNLPKLEQDSAEDVTSPESKGKGPATTEADAFYADVKKDL